MNPFSLVGKINPFTDIDYGNAWNKYIGGDQAADVIKKYDNIGSREIDGIKQLTGTDAYAQGGSKYVSNPNPVPTGVSSDTGGTNVVGGGGGGGTGTSAKTLDLAGLASLDALLSRYGVDLSNALSAATITRDTDLATKKRELEREKGKFDGKILSNTQEYGDTVTGTDMDTRDTLGGLISSLSTLGLGGGAELQRQILSASNRANRQANATQANNARDLTEAFNTYSAGNADDVAKINDQFGYNKAQANKTFNENRQNALYKKAELYRDAGQDSQRANIMKEADGLTGLIGSSTFLNPSYRGESKAMETPELSSFSQDVGSYNTTGLGGATPVDGGGLSAPAVRAVPLNEQDAGIKKKREGELGYGV